MLPEDICDISLTEFNKNDTPPNLFNQLFLSKRENFLNKGWSLIFTDGSKQEYISTSYAVVTEDGEHILLGSFPEFTTQATAILRAAQFSINLKAKTVICTDSLSTLKSILNTSNAKWHIIDKIRDLLITHKNKLKLLWIPSHCNIKGNEFADQAANFANTAPLITENILEKTDLRNHILEKIKLNELRCWYQYNHHYYTNINQYGIPIHYPTDCPKKAIKYYSRLRLGHTIITHQHLIKKESPPLCSYCGTEITIKHILQECAAYNNTRQQIF